MKPILTASEYRRVDHAFEGDLYAAMERAGHAVALAVARRGVGYGDRVAVLVGPGNNGGDGSVAARRLRDRGVDVTIHALGRPKSSLAERAMSAALAAGVRVVDIAAPVETGLVVDGLFGGGSRAGLPDAVAAWTGTERPVVAIDFPTGLDPDTGLAAGEVFNAGETVTFGSLKTGHVLGVGPDHCGAVTVVDIGISGGEPSLLLVEESDVALPPRSRRAHKWSAGSVLVVGGSTGMVGAAVMAAESALRFGAGSVYLATSQPESAHLIAPGIPSIDLDEAVKVANKFDVVVVGPGLAPEESERATDVARTARLVVLDAGGLTPALLASAKEGGSEVVLTPHAAEFKRLTGRSPGTYATRAFAHSEQVVVVMKGNPTMVTDGGLPKLIHVGGPELATIGTGDVLAGMIGAVWSRGLPSERAALSAAYWHGIAGKQLAARGTVTARDLSRHIASLAW